jgi:hypothetical protein
MEACFEITINKKELKELDHCLMLKMVKVKDMFFFFPKLIIDDFLNLDKLINTNCQSSSAG